MSRSHATPPVSQLLRLEPALIKADLDKAILAYLVQRGFPRSAKAFEKEAGTKAGVLGDLQKAWELFAPK